jgi:hypothetical protein
MISEMRRLGTPRHTSRTDYCTRGLYGLSLDLPMYTGALLSLESLQLGSHILPPSSYLYTSAPGTLRPLPLPSLHASLCTPLPPLCVSSIPCLVCLPDDDGVVADGAGVSVVLAVAHHEGHQAAPVHTP